MHAYFVCVEMLQMIICMISPCTCVHFIVVVLLPSAQVSHSASSHCCLRGVSASCLTPFSAASSECSCSRAIRVCYIHKFLC